MSNLTDMSDDHGSQRHAKVFILDFMAMAFRYHHAMQKQPFFTSLGFPTSSIFGVLRALYRIFEQESPDYMVVACDSEGPTFRHKLYADYKAHRQEMPEELQEQIPKLFELFHILNIPVITQAGMEADDIIATLAKKLQDPSTSAVDTDIYIVSNDKDMMQLVGEKVRLYQTLPYNNKVRIVGQEDVKEYFCVPPSQVIAAQALIGDSSDNVPGVAGIGKVTAGKLLKTYTSLSDIYAHLDDITIPSLRLKLERDRKNAFLSEQLVTLKDDLAIGWDLSSGKVDKQYWSCDNHRLDKFLLCCEFKNLRKKYFPASKLKDNLMPFSPLGSHIVDGEDSAHRDVVTKKSLVSSAKDSQDIKPYEDIFGRFFNITTLSSYAFLIDAAKEASFMVLTMMIKTTGKGSIGKDKGFEGISVEGFTVYFAKNLELSDHNECFGYYLNFMDDRLGDKKRFFLSFLKEYFHTFPATLVVYDAKLQLHALANIGFDPYAVTDNTITPVEMLVDDVMVMGCLSEDFPPHPTLKQVIYEYLPYSHHTIKWMKEVYEKYVLHMPVRYDDDQDGLGFVDKINAFWCLLGDVYAGWFVKFSKGLARYGMKKVYQEIEKPLIPVLLSMERCGIHVRREALDEFSKKLLEKKEQLSEEIYGLAGERFNIQSPKQLSQVLFVKLALQKEFKLSSGVYKTSTGYSTRESVLEMMSEAPIVAAVLRYRKVAKLKGTYTDGLIKFIHPDSKRLHSTFRQCGTVTGRMSSSDPNLQNIPIRSEMGKEIRKAFCASGYDTVIISADYSQIELRILAHMSHDKQLIQAFSSGEDVHNWTASVMFAKDLKDVTAQDRHVSKAINYGIIYGMGPRRLAKIISVPYGKAKQLIASYFTHFSQVAEFNDKMVEFARTYGYSQTITGRRRALKDIDSSSPMLKVNAENMARNSPIQGSAADLMKLAMIDVYRRIRQSDLRLKMMVQVHDELVFECVKEDLDASLALIKEAMEDGMDLAVPLRVSIGYGHNWLEAH